MAAEPSGDLQGAALARELRRRVPGLRLLGVGGQHLRESGVELLCDSSAWGTIGPSEAIFKVVGIFFAYRKFRWRLVQERPDLTVVIDSPAIHMRLTRYLKPFGLRTLYYFPPSAWSTSGRRMREIHDRVTAVVTTFAFNYRTYCENNLPVAHYGHPMVDLFWPPPSPDQARSRLNLKEGVYVALMPGSRTQEVRLNTPILVEAARQLKRRHPELRFLLPSASPRVEPTITRLIGACPPWLTVVSGRSRDCMAASRLVLMCSGSVSLEAAVLGVPMVLFYRFNAFDYALAWLLTLVGLLKVRRFALPNLVLDEDVLPELFQNQVTPGRLVQEAERLLPSGPERRRHLEGLERVRLALGKPGVVKKVAAFADAISQGMTTTEALDWVEREL